MHMITTYDHIQELNAELKASIDAIERRQIEAELAAATQAFAAAEAAADALFSDKPPQ